MSTSDPSDAKAWQVTLVPSPGPGNNSNLISSADEVVVIDPPRDGRRVSEAAAQRG